MRFDMFIIIGHVSIQNNDEKGRAVLKSIISLADTKQMTANFQI